MQSSAGTIENAISFAVRERCYRAHSATILAGRCFRARHISRDGVTCLGRVQHFAREALRYSLAKELLVVVLWLPMNSYCGFVVRERCYRAHSATVPARWCCRARHFDHGLAVHASVTYSTWLEKPSDTVSRRSFSRSFRDCL